MYRVLIAEDEMLVRHGLKNAINWHKFDMSIIADVPDGQSAWEIYEKEAPDLIITDLKMPNMGGMELIQKIRNLDKETIIIILSCLDEFELLRKALTLGISGYILKLTMTQEEMEGVLSKVSEELKKKKSTQPAYKISDREVLKEKCIKDFMFYHLYGEGEFVIHVKDLQLRLTQERLVLGVMEIEEFDQLQMKFQDERGYLIRFSILNIIQEVLDIYKNGEAICDEDRRYLILINFPEVLSEKKQQEELYQIFNHIRVVLQMYYNINVTFGISSTRSGYAFMKKMYIESQTALKSKFYTGVGALLYYNNGQAELDPLMLAKIQDLPHKYAVMGEKTFKELRNLHLTTGILKEEGTERIKAAFRQCINSAVEWLQMSGGPVTELIIDAMKRIQESETLAGMIHALDNILNEIMDIKIKKKIISKETAEVLQLIKENFHHDIMLEKFADHVKLSPKYLSSLFKREMGIGISEYVIHYRIEKAKEMILNTQLKSYEIAEKAGFTDNSYFSRLFKRLTGVRPNEYRKQWVIDKVGGQHHEV